MKYLRFRGTPYKATVNEDTPVGTTIFSAIEVNKTLRQEVIFLSTEKNL